jgi:hypothetical protein
VGKSMHMDARCRTGMPGPGIEVLAHPRGKPARSISLLLLVLLVAARLGPVVCNFPGRLD